MAHRETELPRNLRALLEHTGKPYFGHERAPAVWQPSVDIYETKTAVIVLVELAGASPVGVQVEVQGPTLRISGTRRLPFRSDYLRFDRLEIAQGPFERIIPLPAPIDEARAEASYHEGFLEIVLPFATPFRPTVSSAHLTPTE